MNEVTEVTLERTGRRPLRFRGTLVWQWGTSPDMAHLDFSGDPGRWAVLDLYFAQDQGTYVLYEQRCSNWPGERYYLATHTFTTPPEIADWLEQNYPDAVTGYCERFGIVETLRPAGAG